MKRHLVYCGLMAPNLTADQAGQLVRDLAVNHLHKGHTIHEATGRWAGFLRSSGRAYFNRRSMGDGWLWHSGLR